MILSKCLKPLRVRMPDKSFRFVPCGKCEACRSLKTYQWKRRLDSELSCNKYALSITLTYDDAHLPSIIVNPDTTVSYNFFESIREYKISNEVYKDLSNYYRERKDGTFFVPVVSHSDLQEFIKKLKCYAPKIRWFIQSEIGPSTLRSHYHGILFFSEYEPEYVKASIYKAWDKCDWSIREHQDSIHSCSSSSYCTSYVASVLELPKIHQFGRFAMFHYSSNRPPIGSLSYSSDDIRRYEQGESIEVTRYNIRKNSYDTVPYLRHLSDKCFGKLPNYSLLTPAARKFLLLSYRYFGSKRERSSGKFSYECRFNDYSELFSRYLELDESMFDFFANAFTSESSLYRIYRVSKQYVKACEKYSPLLIDYAFEEHYYKLEMAKLRQQYEYEEDFCNRRKISPRWLIFKDLEFVKSYENAFGLVPEWVELSLLGYGYNDIEDFTSNYRNYELGNNADCKAYFSRIHEIIHESHKSKANRSYQRVERASYLSDKHLEQFDIHKQLYGDNKQSLFCPF